VFLHVVRNMTGEGQMPWCRPTQQLFRFYCTDCCGLSLVIMCNIASWPSHWDGCLPKHTSPSLRKSTSTRTLGRTASLSGKCTLEVWL